MHRRTHLLTSNELGVGIIFVFHVHNDREPLRFTAFIITSKSDACDKHNGILMKLIGPTYIVQPSDVFFC